MRFCFIYLVSIFISCSQIYGQNEKTICSISGRVINRESKTILIRKSTQELRSFLKEPIKIPIQNGVFSYNLPFTEIEALELIFEDELDKGMWKPILFFPFNGKIEFELYPQEEWVKNKTSGGELNKEYEIYRELAKLKFQSHKDRLNTTRDSLRQANQLERDEYLQVFKDLRLLSPNDQLARVPLYQKSEELEKTGGRYTEIAKQLYLNPFDSLVKEELKWKYQYIRNNLTLSNYYLLWADAMRVAKDNMLAAQLIKEVFPFYQAKYPNHIYTQSVINQLNGLKTIAIGNNYIDLKALTIKGDTVSLSKVVDNKVTLINFWGSWCGPCIAKMRLIKPVYDKYKSQGFSIVGIAREFQNLKALNNRVKIEQYSWINLVDLDDQFSIWNKYGINNGVGMMILIDSKGKILAIDPKPAELDELLSKKFK